MTKFSQALYAWHGGERGAPSALARVARTPVSTVTRWLREETRPHPKMLRRVAKAFGMTFTEAHKLFDFQPRRDLAQEIDELRRRLEALERK